MPTKKQLAEREEARAKLRELVDRSQKRSDGSPVIYTVLRHVSSSGMSRDISVKIVDGDGDLIDITYTAALALGETPRDRHGWRVIRVGGCGFDAGFHLVYSISWTLYGTGDLAADNAARAGYKIDHEWI